MAGLIIRFIKTGNPRSSTLDWPNYTPVDFMFRAWNITER